MKGLNYIINGERSFRFWLPIPVYDRSGKMSKDKLLRRFHPLEARVRNTLRKYGMLNPGEHVIAGVSGGADSTALLIFLAGIASEFNLTVTAAHLNHGIRNQEADADEDFVRQLCAKSGIPFISERIEVRQHALATKQNLEELARNRRYDFLRRTAARMKAQKVAVGHTLNDQAETVLFRFLRGSGVEGLSGIHPVMEGIIIRPLIECSRTLIVDYLKDRKASFREDSSNADFKYSRNRIRLELIPYLERHFNRQAVTTLAREASLARETWSFMQEQARGHLDRLGVKVGDDLGLNISGLLQLHPALQKQVVRRALKTRIGSLRGITAAHVESVLELCRPGQGHAWTDLPRGHAAERQLGILVLRGNLPSSVTEFTYDLEIPGTCTVAETGAVLTSRITRTPDLSTLRGRGSTEAFLETSVLPERLTIRSREPGDRYGGQGHRKVKKMLIDAGIPQRERSRLPMIAANSDVIWIPGFRPARPYEVRPDSAECIAVTYMEPHGGEGRTR